MFAKSSSWWPVVFLSVALLVDGACSNSSSPTSPSTGSSNSTGSTNTNPGASRVTVTVNPNPVPFSGKPVTDVPGCEKRNNTWYYEQILEETAGVGVTFTTEVDAFDGFVVNSTTVNIAVPARGKVTLNPRWCSATAEKHTAQSTFMGVDAKGNSISVQGPMVNLMAPPKGLEPLPEP
jgi:hypothetical protein